MTPTEHLSRRTLPGLPPAIRRPDFDPARLATGIVHLGVGAFARAHLAAYTQPLLAADPGWGILGVSLRRPDTRDALAAQDWLYACAERDGADERVTVMGAMTGILVAPESSRAVIDRLAHPDVRIVTLTVTEKAYCRDTASGELDETDPLIRHDLSDPTAPASVPGLLVAALAARRAAGVPPFTVLSCDNLPANGDATRRVVSGFAALRDAALGRFVTEQVAFPSCMVDRIVPATTPDDRGAHRRRARRRRRVAGDMRAVPPMGDRGSFPARPPGLGADRARNWSRTSARTRTMKLRLLNGSHSSLAYLGQLAGWPTVAEAIAQPELRRHIEALMQEIATTLRLPTGVDTAAYCGALLLRFANPALHHRTAQIAMDGSQKLPQRLFAPALDRLATGRGAPRIALGVAAWLRFLGGEADGGTGLPLDDPHAARLRAAAARAAGDSRALRDAIFAMPDIVPPALADNAPFANDVLAALDSLAAHGTRRTLATWHPHADDP